MVNDKSQKDVQMVKKSLAMLLLISLIIFPSCASFIPNYSGYSSESKISLRYVFNQYLANSIFQEDIEAICKENNYVVRVFENQNHVEIFGKVNPFDFSPPGLLGLIIYSSVEYRMEFYQFLIYGFNKNPRNFHRAEIECNDKIHVIKNISSQVDVEYDAESIKIVLTPEDIDFLSENWADGKVFITYFGNENIREELDDNDRGLLEIFTLLERNQEISSW